MVETDQGFIFNIQRFSTEDGPGIRTTVFFKQCPLKCIWCHNPESILNKRQLEWFKHKCIGCNTCIDICKYNALSFNESGLKIDRDICISCGECSDECPSTALHMWGEYWNLDDLFYEIQKDKVYYTQSKGGITVSGGEPTIQSDFILKFLKMCKENDIHNALDTCGYAQEHIYRKLLPYVDLVLFDIKEIDLEKHKQFTSIPNDLILRNAIWIANYMKNNNKLFWVRTPIIPNYNATEENIRGIGEFIVYKLDNTPERWDLLAFNNLCSAKYERLNLEWHLKNETLILESQMEYFLEVAQDTGVTNPKWSGLVKGRENEEENK
ncbi:MAG: glycyl-radical enzyme activating protein [Candidatus Lokiarchaeota archaeon]|nr:glycyl-radical enzyme activating protein [Candidatus Lokiarchaeota archaeon]